MQIFLKKNSEEKFKLVEVFVMIADKKLKKYFFRQDCMLFAAYWTLKVLYKISYQYFDYFSIRSLCFFYIVYCKLLWNNSTTGGPVEFCILSFEGF